MYKYNLFCFVQQLIMINNNTNYNTKKILYLEYRNLIVFTKQYNNIKAIDTYL